MRRFIARCAAPVPALVLALALAMTAGARAQAQAADPAQLPTERLVVIDCLGGMKEGETSWEQCLELMFLPCELYTVGSEDHVGCLFKQREEWKHAKRLQETALLGELIPTSAAELTELLSAWELFVADSCRSIAAEKADISAQSAMLGCEISQTVALTAELASCRAGISIEPYCILRE